MLPPLRERKRRRRSPNRPSQSSPCVLLAKYTKYFCFIVSPVVQILLAFTMVYVLIHILEEQNKNSLTAHIFFCTLGLNFLQGMAILINIMAALGYKSALQRAYAHGFLQVLGVIAIIIGVIFLADYSKQNKGGNLNLRNTHSLLGISASIVSIAALFTGAYAIPFEWPIRIIHIIFGLPSFILSSLCLGFGLESLTEKYNYKLGKNIYTPCVMCHYFYTGVVVLFIIMKLILRMCTNACSTPQPRKAF